MTLHLNARIENCKLSCCVNGKSRGEEGSIGFADKISFAARKLLIPPTFKAKVAELKLKTEF